MRVVLRVLCTKYHIFIIEHVTGVHEHTFSCNNTLILIQSGLERNKPQPPYVMIHKRAFLTEINGGVVLDFTKIPSKLDYTKK